MTPPMTPSNPHGSYVGCGDAMASEPFPPPYWMGRVCPESGRYRMIGYRVARVLRRRFV